MVDENNTIQERLLAEAKFYNDFCNEQKRLDIEKLKQLCATQDETIKAATSVEEGTEKLQHAISEWMMISLEAVRRGHNMKPLLNELEEDLPAAIRLYCAQNQMIFGENPPYIKLLEYMMEPSKLASFTEMFYEQGEERPELVFEKFNQIIKEHPVSLGFENYYTGDVVTKTMLRLRGEYLRFQELNLIEITGSLAELPVPHKARLLTAIQVMRKNINELEDVIDQLEETTDGAKEAIQRTAKSCEAVCLILDDVTPLT